jgi:hypothetical protein
LDYRGGICGCKKGPECPHKPGKHPLVRHGAYGATQDEVDLNQPRGKAALISWFAIFPSFQWCLIPENTIDTGWVYARWKGDGVAIMAQTPETQ